MNLLEGHLEKSVRASPIIEKACGDVWPTEGEDEQLQPAALYDLRVRLGIGRK